MFVLALPLRWLFLGPAVAFPIGSSQTVRASRSHLSGTCIDFQREYGRGEKHLSASLLEGDLVVYQGGTWLVDGVEVGDGSESIFRYAMLETMQLVWTHNCEHGVLRGVECYVKDDIATLVEPLNELEFGPEQLVAKIPVQWDETAHFGNLLVHITNDMWVPME